MLVYHEERVMIQVRVMDFTGYLIAHRPVSDLPEPWPGSDMTPRCRHLWQGYELAADLGVRWVLLSGVQFQGLALIHRPVAVLGEECLTVSGGTGQGDHRVTALWSSFFDKRYSCSCFQEVGRRFMVQQVF